MVDAWSYAFVETGKNIRWDANIEHKSIVPPNAYMADITKTLSQMHKVLTLSLEPRAME